MSDQELGPRQLAWINALESGNYEQGKCYLNQDGKYCCLGVACEVFMHELKLVKSKTTNPNKDFFTYNLGHVLLPTVVMEHLGLRSLSGDATIQMLSLTELNDGGLSFSAIANLLKLNPELYFKEPK